MVIEQTNDFNVRTKDDDQEVDRMYCEYEHSDAAHMTDCEFVERISSSNMSLSFACFHVDEASDNENEIKNEIYDDLHDYNLLKETIIAENDRLNKEVDEFLEFDSSLWDDGIADLLINSTQ